MAKWVHHTVKDTIIRIKDKEIVLPVIQRRLVWLEESMELLFDSLLKGNSFGSIICIEEEKDTNPLFAFREFTKDGNDVTSIEIEELSKTQLFIIDGQQRLQSFYIGLIGTYNEKRMFFDLYSNYEESEYSFKFAKSIDDLPTTNNDRSDSATKDCLWYPVDSLFNRMLLTNDAIQVAEEIVSNSEITDTKKIELVETTIEYFYDAVFSYQSIGISKVSVNKDKSVIENRQQIVELFRRLNDGGTRLSSYDLVASTFKGFDYKMEGLLDKVVSENIDIGIDQDTLIKLLLIVNDKPSKEMSDLTAEDADFATTNFERIQESLKVLKQFLKSVSLYNWFANTKKPSPIPLHFLTYNIFHSKYPTDELINSFAESDVSFKNHRNMTTWLQLSLLNKVFNSGCGWLPNKTGIQKIHAIMEENKGKSFPAGALFSMYKEHRLRFSNTVNEYTLNSFDHDFIFYLIYNGQQITRKVDIDHIHPRSLLELQRVDIEKINNIVNYQLLEAGTNRKSKKAKQLHVWIDEEIEETNRIGYLNRHLIPTDPGLWKVSAFDAFFYTRAQLIIKKLKEQLT